MAIAGLRRKDAPGSPSLSAINKMGVIVHCSQHWQSLFTLNNPDNPGISTNGTFEPEAACFLVNSLPVKGDRSVCTARHVKVCTPICAGAVPVPSAYRSFFLLR